ncbi:hypothetical protein B0H10DRAFT_1956381 [Mycena sp. CBHHK59/15]|nr:hypothetical protein B0H10DRAFT_1956381 [Mycena sp. CBHHK59/15]
MPIATRSSARQTRSTTATRSTAMTAGTTAQKKTTLKAKSAPARGKAGKAKSAKGAVAPARGSGVSKTNVVEPLVEEDLAEVEEGDGEISNGTVCFLLQIFWPQLTCYSEENADNLPAEDHSSNDPIPPMLPASPGTPPPPPRPRARPRHNEDSIPPSDAALTDLANDPFNLSGRVTLGKRLQVRTQVQRVEDDEDGHTDDGEEGLELEEQHDELYNFVDNSTLGYDDTVNFAELRAVAPHDLLPRRHSVSLHRASSAKSRRPRRHSIDFPRPRSPSRSSPDDDHRGRRRTRSVGKSVEAQSVSPPASGQGRLESELSHSSDDYANEQAQKARVKIRRAAQGDVVSPSVEDEDEDDEREFEEEVERNGFEDEEVESNGFEDEEDEQEFDEEIEDERPVAKKVDKTKTAEKGGKKKSKKLAGAVEAESGSATAAGGGGRKTRGKAKGKAKKVDNGRDSDCIVGDDGEEDGEDDGKKDDEGDGNLRPGPIPAAVKERLYELYDEFTTAVDELARGCGKSSTTLHQILGTIIKMPRGLNAWNMWQRYFAETTPKEQKYLVKGGDYTKQVRTAFIAACRVGDDFPEEKLKDSNAVFKHLPWLLEWNKKVTRQAVIDIRESGKLKTKLRMATQMQDSFGVHVWGYVIDPEGQGSFVFGTGDDFKKMRALQLHNLNQQYDSMIEMRKRGLAAHSIPIQNLIPHEHERPRDAFRRQFTSIIGGQLWAFCHVASTLSGQDVDKTRFQMKWNMKFIDAAWESKCHIVNYPAALQAANQIIGTQQFNLKKIKAATFERFISGLVKANRTRDANDDDDDDDDVMRIVAWEQDDIDLPLDEQGDVAVVIDKEGVALVTVKQSEGYAKEVKKQAEKVERKKRKKESGAEVQRQDEKAKYAPPPPGPRHREDNGDAYRQYEGYTREDLQCPYRRSRSPSRAQSWRNYRRSRSPSCAGASRHYPRTHSRSGSPPWAGASHDYRACAHSRLRSPPGAGASDHYRPRHSRSRSPARAGSSRQYAGKYRDYSRGANSPPHARSPPRAPKSPRQQEPWPRNDNACQWDDVPPYPRPNGRVESSRPTLAVLPRIDFSRVDAVAARVGAARHDDRAQGEQCGPKRKVPHDEGLESDRDSKRHRGTEEVPPLLMATGKLILILLGLGWTNVATKYQTYAYILEMNSEELCLHVETANPPLFVQAFSPFAADPNAPSTGSHGLDMDPEIGPNIILTDSTCILQKRGGGGGVFLATCLQEDDKPTRAASFMLVHNPVRHVWKLLRANQAPVLATEEDRIQYAKELEDFGL